MSFSEKVLEAFGLSLDSDIINIRDRDEVLQGARYASGQLGTSLGRAEIVEAMQELARFLEEWDVKTLVEIEEATNAPFSASDDGQENLRQAIRTIVDSLGHELELRDRGGR